MKRFFLPLLLVAIPLLLTTGCITEDGLTISIPFSQHIRVNGVDVCNAIKKQRPELQGFNCDGDRTQEFDLSNQNLDVPLGRFPVDIKNELAKKVPDYAKRTISRLGVDSLTVKGSNGLGFNLPRASVYIVANENANPSGEPFIKLPELPAGKLNITGQGSNKEASREATELIKSGSFYIVPKLTEIPGKVTLPIDGSLEATVTITISISFNPIKAVTGLFEK